MGPNSVGSSNVSGKARSGRKAKRGLPDWKGGGSQARDYAESAILSALILAAKPLSWSDLLSQTKLSRSTLAKRLDDLAVKGLVKRRMLVSAKYPPPVLYEATESAKNSRIQKATLFATAASNSFGRDVWDRNLASADLLRDIGNKIASYMIYVHLKNFEERISDPRTNSIVADQERPTKIALEEFLRKFVERDTWGKLSNYLGNIETKAKTERSQRFSELLRAFNEVYKTEAPALEYIWQHPNEVIDLKIRRKIDDVHMGEIIMEIGGQEDAGSTDSVESSGA